MNINNFWENFEWDAKKVNEYFSNEKIEEIQEEITNQLQKKIVLGFFGTASAGKDSGIKALFGHDFGDINPDPGSTDKVKIISVDDHLIVLNAPGFGDIKNEISQKAKEVLDDVDIFVYVVNAEGGVKKQEKEDYRMLKATGKDVLVVLNKIDLIRDNQKESFILSQREKLGVEPENFIPVSFDPLPQISEKPINLDKVVSWLNNKLTEKGKDILFAKYIIGKDIICEAIIRKTTMKAFAIGVIPIPGSDIFPLTALQIRMGLKIAEVYGHKVDKVAVKQVIANVLAGNIGKQVFRWGLSLLKSVGWLSGPADAVVSGIAGAFAASTTYGLGKAFQLFYKNNMNVPVIELERTFNQAFKEYKSKSKEIKKLQEEIKDADIDADFD